MYKVYVQCYVRTYKEPCWNEAGGKQLPFKGVKHSLWKQEPGQQLRDNKLQQEQITKKQAPVKAPNEKKTQISSRRKG